MKQPSLKTLEKKVSQFNSTYACGCKVDLRMDSGEIIAVTVDSKAYVMGGHSAVAHFKEISGCYSIDRVNSLTS